MTPSSLARLLLTAVLIPAAGACTGSPSQRPVKLSPVSEAPGSLAAARKFLEGRWSLETFEVYQAGKPTAMKGAGTLTYDGFGNLRMEIRADPETAGRLKAAGLDIKDGVISTDGRTAVDMPNKTLTYVLENQGAGATAGPMATNRPRHWQVEGDVLTLTTKDDAGNPASVSRWKKVP